MGIQLWRHQQLDRFLTRTIILFSSRIDGIYDLQTHNYLHLIAPAQNINIIFAANKFFFSFKIFVVSIEDESRR